MTTSMAVVVMGVTSTGKTTVGKMLAERLHARFAEGDEYHSTANVEKMRSGQPLNDDDRRPWLEAIAKDLRRWLEDGIPAVVTCSALKRRYRDILRQAGPGVRFVHLSGGVDLIQRRMEGRHGHYMPVSLLPSQLEALESPAGEPDVVEVEIDGEPEEIVARALKALERGRLEEARSLR